nr:IS66 family transposase [Fibrobacterota bacterium]
MSSSSAIIPENYDALKDAYIETAQENESLRRQVEFFRKHFFGTKSERSLLSPSDQTSLLDAQESQAVGPFSGTTVVASHGRKRRSRNEAEEGLPLVTILHDLSEDEKRCGCGKAMEAVKEERTVVREYQPPKLFLEEHLTPCYQCPACQKTPCSAPSPSMPIENGTLGPGLLAHILTGKYCDHLPLNRLEKILGRHGMEIPKSTMARAIGQVAQLLEPIVKIIKTELLATGLVHIDDTPVQVLDESKTGQSHRGYFWALCNKESAVIRFTKSRSHEEPAKWFEGYRGYLVADAFGVNQWLGESEGVTLCACLAHVRRKFFDLKDSEPLAAEMVTRIGKLYEVEKEARDGGLSPPQHLELRRNKSAPLFESLRAFILEKEGRVLPKSSLGQAFFYARERLPSLAPFLSDSAVPLDNNLAERCLRHEVIGRKNWMFAGSFDGAHSAATIFSLVMTCKFLGIDPWAYLKDTLSRVADHSVH